MAYLGSKKYFSQKLVLNQWLLTRKDGDPGLSANRQHLYLDALLVHYQPSRGSTDAQLQAFDDHIVAQTHAINRCRRDPIQWKYFQWASLLFAEIYLFA